jgi:hypothetical protein
MDRRGQQKNSMTLRVYIVPPAIFAPAILSAIAVVAAARESWWRVRRKNLIVWCFSVEQTRDPQCGDQENRGYPQRHG